MACVAIIGGGLQALSAAYSLKRKKHKVVCIAHGDDLKHFRYIDTYVDSGNHSIASSAYLQFLIETFTLNNVDVVIPMSDKTAEFLSRHKAHIEEKTHTKCAVPEYNIFEQGADKAQLMCFCEKHSFSHPKTRKITIDNLEIVAAYVGFPSLIKPNHSAGARGITLVNNLTELNDKFPIVQKQYGDCTLQEYVDSGSAPYYNVMLYRNSQGQVLAHTIIEILRFYPIKGGSSSYCRTIENTALINECTQVLTTLDWKGMADFDVLQNNKGEYKIIEINPRVPASLRAADIAGVNFPDIIVRDLLNIPQGHTTYQTNKYLRFFGLDIMWFIHSPQRFSFRPSWFCSVGKNIFFQDIYASAPSTWFAWLIDGIRKLKQRKKLHQQ